MGFRYESAAILSFELYLMSMQKQICTVILLSFELDNVSSELKPPQNFKSLNFEIWLAFRAQDQKIIIFVFIIADFGQILIFISSVISHIEGVMNLGRRFISAEVHSYSNLIHLLEFFLAPYCAIFLSAIPSKVFLWEKGWELAIGFVKIFLIEKFPYFFFTWFRIQYHISNSCAVFREFEENGGIFSFYFKLVIDIIFGSDVIFLVAWKNLEFSVRSKDCDKVFVFLDLLG